MRNSQSLEGVTEVQGVESLEFTAAQWLQHFGASVNLPNCRKSLTFGPEGPLGFDFNCSLEGINFALWNIYCNFWEGNMKVWDEL